jgi:hypothetical protein
MKPRFFIQTVVLAAVMPVSLAVFADTSGEPPGPRASSAKPSAPVKASGIKGALRTSKTGMGARIDYVVETPVAGQTTLVRLKIEGKESGPRFSMEVVPGDGLQLVRGLPGGRAEQTDATVEHVLAINPTADGLYYLNVFLRSGDMTEAMAIAIPVGKTPALAKPVTPQITPDGRKIISIPAQQ